MDTVSISANRFPSTPHRSGYKTCRHIKLGPLIPYNIKSLEPGAVCYSNRSLTLTLTFWWLVINVCVLLIHVFTFLSSYMYPQTEPHAFIKWARRNRYPLDVIQSTIIHWQDPPIDAITTTTITVAPRHSRRPFLPCHWHRPPDPPRPPSKRTPRGPRARACSARPSTLRNSCT